MSRQHTPPILIPAGPGSSAALQSVDRGTSATGVTEGWIQTLVQNHPECLPISEIDPVFANPVPICMELSTPRTAYGKGSPIGVSHLAG